MRNGASNNGSSWPGSTPVRATRLPQVPDTGHGSPGTLRDPMIPALSGVQSGVKPRLTSRRRRRVTENDEYAAFARRVLRAWARRVAAGDIDAVAGLAAAARELDDALRDAVTGLRGKGYSWAEIATRLSVTRQAAQQRWGSSGKTAVNERAREQEKRTTNVE
jgi:hypothetical protein